MFLGEPETMEESSGGGELGGVGGIMDGEEMGMEFYPGYHSLETHNFTGFTPQILVEEECLSLFGNLSSVPLNVTCLGHAPTLSQSRMTRAIILIAMAVFSLMGNVATMLSIRKSKRHKSIHVYTLIYHLSIADLWVTFWCITGEALWFITVEWKAGNWGCKVFKFSQMFGLYVSTFIMVLIGVDRFIAVKYPLKSMRKGLCNRLVAACWGISAVLSLPQIVVFHVDVGPFVEEFYQCVTYGTYTAEWQEHLYATFTILFMFIIPLVILATTYLLTFCTLQRNEEILDHSGSFRTLIDPNRRKLIRRAKMKSLRISVAIVTTFIICWTPYYAMMITFLFFIPNRHQILSDDMQSGIFFFGMSNSLFNPLIYGIFHLWKPRRKELQRGISSRRTLLTNLSFERRRSSAGTILNGSIANNNRLGNGTTVTGKHGSILTTTTHSNGGGTISMGSGRDGDGSLIKKPSLDENNHHHHIHLQDNNLNNHNHHHHHHHHHHNNFQQQHHHHLNVMPSGVVGGVHQLLSGSGGGVTGTETNSTASSVCICNNKNGNGAMMEDNVLNTGGVGAAVTVTAAATTVMLLKK